MDFGETQYANAGDVDIAYRVFGVDDAPAEAPGEHLGPLDKARVRLARNNPRTSRVISRLVMKGADESLTPK